MKVSRLANFETVQKDLAVRILVLSRHRVALVCTSGKNGWLQESVSSLSIEHSTARALQGEVGFYR